MYSRYFQDFRVQESNATCNIENKGLLRIRKLHLEFCNGKSWVRLLHQKIALNSREKGGQYSKPEESSRVFKGVINSSMCVAVWNIQFTLFVGVDCMDIKKKGHAVGDGLYWLDPDGGSHLNAFLAYCEMTSLNGG